jgi:DUF4097 and DUF4098 domain-containing protein YvlB
MEYDKWKVDYTELEPFENIQVNAACGDISMKPAESWGISYVIYGEEPSCEVLDNTLYVNFKGSDNSDTGFAFYLDFEIPNGSQDSELCIYYPKEEAANLKNMNIVTEYGDISLEQLVCDSVQIKNECGDVAVNSSAFQNSSIEMDYGDLDASKTDFGNADIKLTCGDLQIEEGQACDMNIDAEYGDMKIRLLNPENVKYGYDIKTEFGDLRLNGEKYGDTSNVININESDFVIKVVSQCGDVDISVQ